MLPWWGWLLLWAAIVVASGWLLWRASRGVWRELRATGAQLADAESAVAELRTHSPDSPNAPKAPLALSRHIQEVARERAELAQTLKDRRIARRERRLPPWARRVH